jgi:hypothetical protein
VLRLAYCPSDFNPEAGSEKTLKRKALPYESDSGKLREQVPILVRQFDG